MIEKSMRFLRSLRDFQRVNMSLTRGNVTRAMRNVRLHDPVTWEFSGFSQNGEDGILEVLLSRLSITNRYFIEIGASDGLENNTTWLCLVHRYSGLWLEADSASAGRARELFSPLNHGLALRQLAITPGNVAVALSDQRFTNPDVLSVDIDSYDYFIAEALLQLGMRPKVFVVEYNSAFGPTSSLTVPEDYVVSAHRTPPDRLYYGCSLGAWRVLFNRFGYTFITVERNGVNAFFVDPTAFDPGFLERIDGLPFAENYSHSVNWPQGWTSQWGLIQDRDFTEIDPQ